MQFSLTPHSVNRAGVPLGALQSYTSSNGLHARPYAFSSLSKRSNKRLSTSRRVANEVGQQYDGLFGKWTLDEHDQREVLSYRAGLSVATAVACLHCSAQSLPFSHKKMFINTFWDHSLKSVTDQWAPTQLLRAALLIDTFITLLPDDNALKGLLRPIINPVAVAGAGSLAVSYVLIHIYVAPLKRFLQALCALGTLGGLFLMFSQGEAITEYVAHHREAMWLIGPLFASVTGLGIKEGLCYGTPAAAGILLVTPIMCLGHLTGLMPEGGTIGLLVTFNLLALVFAAGKYKQDIKGDIGDKSIFEVQALPKEEQERRWAELQSRRES